MSEPATTTVTLEESKATVDVQAVVVSDFKMERDIASLLCPKCHRRIGIAPGTPYRHTCGAIIVAQKEGA